MTRLSDGLLQELASLPEDSPSYSRLLARELLELRELVHGNEVHVGQLLKANVRLERRLTAAERVIGLGKLLCINHPYDTQIWTGFINALDAYDKVIANANEKVRG